MIKNILIMLFTLAGLAGMAQTNEPLPGDAEPLTNQLYLSPSDSTVWAADPFSGLAINLGSWWKVDSVFDSMGTPGGTPVHIDNITGDSIISPTNRYVFDGWASYISDTIYHYSEGFIATLPDGDIINFFRKGLASEGHQGNSGDIYARRSSDGVNWAPEYLVYSSEYDDRNIYGGITDDGKVIVWFRRLDAPPLSTGTQVDMGYIYSTDASYENWSTYTAVSLIKSSGGSPYGAMVKNGAGKYLKTVSSSEGWCEMFSSDDGTLWVSEGLIWDYSESPGIKPNEVSIANVGGDNFIALARDQAGGLGYLQFESTDDGETWSYVGATNIDGGYDSPSPIIYHDGGILFAIGTRRDIQTAHTNSISIYINEVASVLSQPNAWEVKKTLKRPMPNRASFYGYPGIAKRDSLSYVLIFTDREIPIPKGLGSQNENSALFQLTVHNKPTSDGKLIESDYGELPYEFNMITGQYDPTASPSVGRLIDGTTTLYSSRLEADTIYSESQESQSIKTTNIETNSAIISQSMRLGPSITPSSSFYNGSILTSTGTSHANRTQATATAATSVAYGSRIQISTSPEPFNLSAAIANQVDGASIGAGSSITNQRGYVVHSSFIGATNNYGFVGDIPAGSGRWNIYMSGSAANYMNGNLLVGTTTDSGQKVTINGGVSATQYRLSALNTAPASASATGTTGEIRITTDYIYICVGTNQWKRVAISTW